MQKFTTWISNKYIWIETKIYFSRTSKLINLTIFDCFSVRSPEFYSRSIKVESLVEKVALRQDIFNTLHFQCQYNFTDVSLSFMYLPAP